MQSNRTSAISRVVEQLGGPCALSKLMDGTPAYQEIQRWVKRGWASPHHIFRLEPNLPRGISVRDLYEDKERATKALGERQVAPETALSGCGEVDEHDDEAGGESDA